MSLMSRLSRPGPTGFGYGSTAEEVSAELDLSGRTYVVTGTTSGLGQETVRVLLLRGADVVALGRSVPRVLEATQGFSGQERLRPLALELSDLVSVAEAAKTIRSWGISPAALILNAGVMALPKLELISGYERQFLTNHIGHYYFARLLEPTLGPKSRVVILSSDAHRVAPKVGIDFDNLRGEKTYQGWSAYGRSKLANLLFAYEFGERLKTSQRIAHAIHPGVIDTPLNRHMPALVRAVYPLGSLLALKSVHEGAATQVFVATHPKVPYDAPHYWADSNIREPRQIALDRELQKQLWKVSTNIVNELGPEKLSD